MLRALLREQDRESDKKKIKIKIYNVNEERNQKMEGRKNYTSCIYNIIKVRNISL